MLWPPLALSPQPHLSSLSHPGPLCVWFLLAGAPSSAFRSPGKLPVTSRSGPQVSAPLLDDVITVAVHTGQCGFQFSLTVQPQPGVLEFSSDAVSPKLRPQRLWASASKGCQSQGSRVPRPPEQLVTNSRDPSPLGFNDSSEQVRERRKDARGGSFIIKRTRRARPGRRCRAPSPCGHILAFTTQEAP